tara:strand:- start:749 stop:1027 length:279 start_codon:yes stop_codon:yes gene_type:complete
MLKGIKKLKDVQAQRKNLPKGRLKTLISEGRVGGSRTGYVRGVKKKRSEAAWNLREWKKDNPRKKRGKGSPSNKQVKSLARSISGVPSRKKK